MGVENARNCIVMLTRTPERPEVTNADALSNILTGWKLSNKKLWLNDLDMGELADSIIEEVGKGKKVEKVVQEEAQQEVAPKENVEAASEGKKKKNKKKNG